MDYFFAFLWVAIAIYLWVKWIHWLRTGIIFERGGYIFREKQPFFYWIGMCSTGLATLVWTGISVLFVGITIFSLEL